MDHNRDRKKIESIIREPLTRLRFVLNGKIEKAQNEDEPEPFGLQDLMEFVASIPTKDLAFQQEALNIFEAMATGVAPQKPQFDTPEKQLAWGAALAFLNLNPETMKLWQSPVESGEVRESDLWKQITSTRHALQELASHGHHIQEALRDKFKYGWSEPGTGFAYDRNKKVINIDLMQTMIVGFEHARAEVYREVGHAMLSVTFPKRMQQLYREMKPLLIKADKAKRAKEKKQKGQDLKPEEYKKLRMLQIEWDLRYKMFDAAEENVANRFVSNMGQQMLQDFSVSLNNTAVTFRAMGLKRLPSNDNASPEYRRYLNLVNAVQLGFFESNELFDKSTKGWMRVGVDPNMVRRSATLNARPDDQKDDRDGIDHPDFQRLRELCAGPKGLEHLQPKNHEKLYGNLRGRIARMDVERKAVLEQIMREYGDDLIAKILLQAEKQLDEKMEEQKKQKQKQKSPEEQEGDEGDEGDDQGQEGDDGDDNDSDQEGQGKGKGKKGKKSKKRQRGQQQGERDDDLDDSDDSDSDDADGEDDEQSGDKKDKKDKGKNKKDKKDKGEKSDEDGEGSEGGDNPEDGESGEDTDAEGDDPGNAESEIGENDDTVPVEDVGDMPDANRPMEDPGDETDPSKDPNGKDAEGEDADGDGNDADGEDGDDDGKTVEELEQEAEEADSEEGDDADGQDADGEGEGKAQKKKSRQKSKGGKPGKGAGRSDGRLADFAKQDWTKYSDRINELSPIIARVRKIFKDIQERQLQRKIVQSRQLDMLPDNGDLKGSFNNDAQRNLTIKKAVGFVEREDLNRFHKEETKLVPTQVDIFIMIDGSGSMGHAIGRMSANPSPLEVALQTGAILFEAASGKDMNMNVYVGLWGNANPPILIKPGDDRVKIGQAMEASKSGLQSGTDFAPAVEKMLEVASDQREKSGVLSGFTHVLILSDGDAVDKPQDVISRIKAIFDNSDKVTFDLAVINGNKGSPMEQFAKNIKGSKPFQNFGVVVGKDPEQIPMSIVGLLLDKIRKCGSFVAVPTSKKRRALQRAHHQITQKPKR